MGENYNYWKSREWMYKRIDERTNNISAEFSAGVEEFMNFANSQPLAQSSGGKFYCPCSVCKNDKFLTGRKIWNHLYTRGFMPEYYVWYMHGEQLNIDLGTSHVDSNNPSGSQTEVSNIDDRYVDMVNDAFRGTSVYDNYHQNESYQNMEEPNYESRKFYDMLEAAKQPLYDGCHEGHTQLSLAARFMNIKANNNLGEKCMDSWAELFTEYLPADNQATGSYYETEKLMRNLGLPFYTIDVCINNCMIFWKEDEKWDNCRFCDAPRYKPSEGRTKIPFSRMWYLPIADRLKRMYQSEKTAAAMRWHAEHEAEEGEMCHPSDGAEWKNFQQLHRHFADEPRNVYLGLCTDGFNPFGMSRNHSLWPVILTPYNLPPGMCMNEEYLFLTILNSGPNHPRSSLDVFLRPLIDELKELWNSGVEAFDASLNQNFNLKAVLMWTISDFPAYGMLSGWTTHGRLSCPICMDDTKAFQLTNGKKTCWFDCHRRFLPRGHPLRKNKTNFLKRKDALNDYPPRSLTGEQVLKEQIRQVNPPKTSECGGNGHDVKKKGYGNWHNWHKESIFWELPYWTDLNLRHNLDVMHIEKNFFDNIINTVMNVKDKSKDTVKARLDIAIFCNRKDLHVDDYGRAPFPIFRLTPQAKERLLECVKHEVKFPDGYASDLASCVDIDGGKFSGMKSHDCHVFMERLLPFIFAELLPRNVHLALSGVGVFFRDLCSRSLKQSTVRSLKENIVIILCNLEKIFPPAFFDVMEHLAVHLPYEAELGGPVQYRWMYPFERFFKKLKSKAKNKRYPAGSIIQSYINDEISYFSEHYFAAHIHTKLRSTRFDEGEAHVYHVQGIPDIFTHVGRPSGKRKEIWFSEKDYQCVHAYVLRNCDYFRPYERLFEEQIRFQYPELSEEDISSKCDEEFPTWIKDFVASTINSSGAESFPIWVQDLVQGPLNKASTWPIYFTRGYLFHTRNYGQRRKTCNYGICVKGANYSDASDEVDFHGTLTDIIQLQYPGLVNLKITLFKCEWYDPTIGKGTRMSMNGIVDVLASGKYNKYEPFILASQADQVCYIPYPYIKQPKKLWLNVLKVNPRANIYGNYKSKEPTLLQQETDDDAMVTTIEEIVVDHLADKRNLFEEIDFDAGDAEVEDEFQCNLSSSDDEEERVTMSGIGRSVKGRGGGRGASHGGGRGASYGGGRGTSHGGGRGATRGGSQAGGVNTSSGRIYFASNPSTSNSRDSVSAPENSPPSETLRQSPPVSASSPARDGSSSPTEQHSHQTQTPHPPARQNPMTLDDLLAIPGRENHLPVLSLVPKEGSTWFDRDDGKLTRKISKLLKAKFDDAYYCWTVTPPDIRRRYFEDFAQGHHWDRSITTLVRDEFEIICLDRMKGMVCQAKRKGIRPAWIGDTLWKKMCAYWATDAAKKKSQTASNSRNSDRGGLGPFKHFAGQMSFLRVQQKMEAELGRPVSIGEVFLRTHTKADGTFSDLKAEQIGQAYEKKLDEKMSQVEQDVCANGGDSSHIPELSPTEMNEIFLETTTLDMRGHEYGLGSLLPLYGNKKRKGGPGTSTSSAFAQLQEQLEAAQRLFEEQAAANTRRDAETAAANARRDAETAARDADHQTQINTLKMLLTYMQGKDPSFSEFMIAASASARTTPMP